MEMDGRQRFYICEICGNLVGLVNNKRVPINCCGQSMAELKPNKVEASTEKHLPDVKVSGDEISVQIGTTAHPMEEGHYISFVYIETENGGQRKALKVGAQPVAKFRLADDKAIAAYAYCNLHGLWKTDL